MLIAGWLVSLWCQRDTGLADNGDFVRSAGTFTTGPTGLPPGLPDLDTEAHQKRFYRYWLPHWDWHLSRQRPNTSVDVVWAPGVLACAARAGGGGLDLRVISIFPKLLLLGQWLLIARWAWRQPAYRLTLLITVGIPAAMVLTTTDYLAYLQSFYQETASLVFVLPLLFSLIYFRRSPSVARLAITLGGLVLLTTAKRSNFYWPVLTLPFLLSAWLAGRPEQRERLRSKGKAAAFGLVAAVVLAFGSLEATHLGGYANPYDSFFYGALTFSSRPAAHLERCGLAGSANCVNHSAYSAVGSKFMHEHPAGIPHSDALLTYARDPGALGAAVGYVCSNMQDISLEYLGKYAPGDPRAESRVPLEWQSPEGRLSAEQRYWGANAESTIWNAWSVLKYRYFPTGVMLAACLCALAGWFAWSLSRGQESVAQEVSLVGLISTLACAVDMLVAILGDGRYELIKHLFMANLLFDISSVAFLASLSLWVSKQGGSAGLRTTYQRANLRQGSSLLHYPEMSAAQRADE